MSAQAANMSFLYKKTSFPVEDKDWRQVKCLQLWGRDKTAVLNWKVSKQELDWVHVYPFLKKNKKFSPLFRSKIHKVVHLELSCQRETLKAQFYCNNLRHLRKNIQQKQPKLVHAKVPLCATTQRIENIFGHSNTIIAHHLRRSTDLAMCEFFQFHKMKIKFKGQCSDALEEFQHASQMHWWNGTILSNLKISVTLEVGEDDLEGEVLFFNGLNIRNFWSYLMFF